MSRRAFAYGLTLSAGMWALLFLAGVAVVGAVR